MKKMMSYYTVMFLLCIMFCVLGTACTYAENETSAREESMETQKGDSQYHMQEGESFSREWYQEDSGLPPGIYREKDIGRWEYQRHVRNESELQNEYRAYRDRIRHAADERHLLWQQHEQYNEPNRGEFEQPEYEEKEESAAESEQKK
jgi:hypothetical protein